ncbi:MAG: hypothetical protein WC836_15340 [Desulfobacula sp.]|jgi:hypothetical protein
MIDWDDDRTNADRAEEEILELTDIVMDAPVSGEDNDIIDLTDIVNDKGMDLNPDIEKVETESSDEDFDTDFEPEEKLITAPVMNHDDERAPNVTSLTSEQIETALEKIIEKQFADKIETLLFQVMEKVIEREIAGIRESLQKDLDQIGNV